MSKPTPKFALVFTPDPAKPGHTVESDDPNTLYVLAKGLDDSSIPWTIYTDLITVVAQSNPLHQKVDKARWLILDKELAAYQAAVEAHHEWDANGRPGDMAVDHYHGEQHEMESNVDLVEHRVAFAAAELFGYLAHFQSPDINPETGEPKPFLAPIQAFAFAVKQQGD